VLLIGVERLPEDARGGVVNEDVEGAERPDLV
jgi:hypothetical protein